MQNNQVVIGEEYELDIDGRYFLQNAETAMKSDIIRGLVELITNSDDSYDNLKERNKIVNGSIYISITRKRNNKDSIIKILDFAEGMTLDEMIKKLKRVGGTTSGFMETEGKRRGLMGRGAKECVVFGKLKFQSIKDDVYSEIEIIQPAKFKPISQKEATACERIEIGIGEGNGTLVMLEVDPRFKIPVTDTLERNLPRYYSLRDIASNPERELTLDGKCLTYSYPHGEIKYDNSITIPDYPEAKTLLVIEKSSNRINCDSSSPYWEGGILVKSNKAIHGISTLSRKIENNPYFEFYFGKVICPYIDILTSEYENVENVKGKHSDQNPCRIIDPLRAEGLVKNHPFTSALYREIEKKLEVFLKNDEEKAKEETQEIENKRTKERFNRLANEAGKFIKDNINELEIEDENYLATSEIKSGGISIIPAGLKLSVNEEKNVYVYVHPIELNTEKHAIASYDQDCIELPNEVISLSDRGDGAWVGVCTVRGVKEGSSKISFSWNTISHDIPVKVTSENNTPIEIEQFQFEKDNYSVKEGKIKHLKIFAQWPEFIYNRIKLKISINDNRYAELLTENITIDYDAKLTDFYGRRIASGTVKILGHKAGGPIHISTIFKGKDIVAKIRIIPKKEMGKDFRIEISPDDLGDIRAAFFDAENLIKINGQHKNIKRYLGPAPEYNGQLTIHFRLLMAELIADTVARRILESNAQKNASEYRDLDVTAFYRKHREYMNKFLEIAHKIQVPEKDITDQNRI